ncbi:MAG: hypothetical protein SGCHY_000140 [Lobulomycetales sp.]
MISGFFIFDSKGQVLISRLFRSDIKRSVADIFRIQVISSIDVRTPLLTLGSTSFFHIKDENLYIVAVTKGNPNTALVFEFLHRFSLLARSYFGGKFDQDGVKNNFTLIYELLDEICDFGYPQLTEPDALKQYIITESVSLNSKSLSGRKASTPEKIAIQTTGAVSWRRQGIKYRKNEAFVDVIESVNLITSPRGQVLQSEVAGRVMMRAYISGMPECKIGLNDKVVIPTGQGPSAAYSRDITKSGKPTVSLDDCQFHQCVKLSNFSAERTITFIPPGRQTLLFFYPTTYSYAKHPTSTLDKDGEFELMKYRSTENTRLPFKVHAVVTEVNSTLVEYKVVVKSMYGAKLYGKDVILRIPTPSNTGSVKVSVTVGKSKYVGAENAIVWKIPRFPGHKEFLLSGHADLTKRNESSAASADARGKQVWSRPPITMNFSVLMFTASGLYVRFLKIYNPSGSDTVKWVRYVCQAGNYQIRF